MGMKAFRKKMGLTQQEAASIFNLKYRTYQNYENGVTSPDLEQAAKFAVFFKCTIGELFDLEEGDERAESADEEVLVSNYRELNELGQQKLVDYSSDLIATGNYIRSQT